MLQEFDPPEKYIMLFSYAKNTDGETQPVRGDLWLQKEIFLLSQAVPDLRSEFEPWKMGPHSEIVDEYKDQLIESGYLTQNNNIRLTADGSKVAKDLWQEATADEKHLIRGIKQFANSLSRDELLAFVYFIFNDSSENSEVLDGIARKRQGLALSLFRRKKVPVEVAARISGEELQAFIKKAVKEGGIKPQDEKVVDILSLLGKRDRVIKRQDLKAEIIRLTRDLEIHWINTAKKNFSSDDLSLQGIDKVAGELQKTAVDAAVVGAYNKTANSNEYLTYHILD